MSIQETKAWVEEVTPLTNTIIQVYLQPEQYISYEAGQFMEIQVDDQWQAYSLANAPLGARHYELHIRHSGSNPYSEPLFAQIKAQGQLRIRLPLGQCSFSRLHAQQPIIFIAGGTGLAPAKAMIEQLLATDDPRSYALWWAARSQSDLYLDEKLRQWQIHVQQFEYFSFLANEQQKPMIEIICDHYGSAIHACQLILAGPFDMVYAARDRLLQQGIARASMMADAFDFEEK